jgi:hypothetical protein
MKMFKLEICIVGVDGEGDEAFQEFVRSFESDVTNGRAGAKITHTDSVELGEWEGHELNNPEATSEQYLKYFK